MPSLNIPIFVTPSDVITRMQLDGTLDGIQEVVTSGIIGAQLHVERILGGSLHRKAQDCLFFLDGSAFSGLQPGGVFRLEIPAPFIRRDVSPTITTSDAPFGSFTAIDSTLVKVDYDRGYVLVDASYADTYVKVQCATGFEDGTTTPFPITGLTAYDNDQVYAVGDKVVFDGVAYVCIEATVAGQDPTDTVKWSPAYVPTEQIPVEVYESILALVPMVFNANQTTNRSNEAEKQYKTLTDHANSLLQPFLRTKGFSFRPVWA